MAKGHEQTFKSKPPYPLGIFVVFLFISATIIIASYIFYKNQELLVKSQQSEMISAVNDFKVRQIVSWRHERLEDAMVIQKTVPLMRLIGLYYQNPSAENENEIRDWMKSISSSHGYDDLVLLDLKKRVRLAAGHNVRAIGKEAADFADRAMREGEIVFSPLRWGEVRKIMRSDIFIPLYLSNNGKKAPIGIMILRTNPEREFFPLIQSWPTPSHTAETLLVRREGDNVLFLNELRHRKDTALKFTLPLSTDKLPASMAALGREGVFEGIDYRGVPVLSAIRAVSGTDMYMVSKIDTDEIYSSMHRQSWMIVVISLIMICLAGAVLWFLWRKREAESFRALYESELRRQSLLTRYEIITQDASDVIVMMDEHWRLAEVNESALQTYGYTREEMIGMNISVLRDASSQAAIEQEIERLDKKGRHTYETLHRRKDGSIIDVEVSASKLIIEGKPFFLETVRDISIRKRVEEALRESEEKFRTIFENSSAAMAIIEKDTTISMVNKEYLKIGLFEEKDVVGKSWTNQIPPEDMERLKEYNRQRLIDPKSAPDSYEFTFYRKDGEIRHSLISVAMIPTSQKIVCSFIDITERKQAETERERLIGELQNAFEQIKTLKGIIPICAQCKKIRDDKGYWQQVESYVSRHTEAQFSHGICPECMNKLYPEFSEDEDKTGSSN
ncbi:MAG: hypothetical protein CSYNP_02585 [Syntrophus sp. SKADARSKE-3]|nr:hypothetical protein [Syntrophus sp. SKADARSKE-3]